MYFLYKSSISLCEMAPGLVKLNTPRQSCSVISMLTGNRSYNTDMELGMFTTRSYLEIFVTKLRGDRSSEMGMRTRRISTLEYTFCN